LPYPEYIVDTRMRHERGSLWEILRRRNDRALSLISGSVA
jgi:hypothetical protein